MSKDNRARPSASKSGKKGSVNGHVKSSGKFQGSATKGCRPSKPPRPPKKK